MKKVISISLMLMIVLFMTCNVYAKIDSCQIIATTSKEEFSHNEEFVVEVKTSSLQSDKGIISFSGKLNYDKENLILSKMEGKNGWETPTEGNNGYNPETGNIVITRSALGSNPETILTMTFKVKGQKAYINSINLKELQVADGDKLYKVGDIIVTKVAVNPPTPDENQGGNNNQGNNQGGDNNQGNNQGGDNNQGNNQGGNNNQGNNQGGNNNQGNNQGGSNNQGNNQGGNNNQGNNQGGNNNQGNNQGGSNNQGNNQGGNNNQGNNQSGNNNQNGTNKGNIVSIQKIESSKDNKIPQTGENTVMYLALGIGILIIAISSFVLMKKIK